MIVHQCAQRSEEWFDLRRGIPTASSFDKIITPGGRTSSQAKAYMYTLLAEWMLSESSDAIETAWMVRGVELEDAAVSAFEMATDTETVPVGFVTTDDGLVGCSPDRLVGSDGVLEIKCGKDNTHVGYLLTDGIEADYKPQVQGLLWITERERLWTCAYHPKLPTVVREVGRDDAYIKLLAGLVADFTGQLMECRETLTRRYPHFPVKKKTAAERAAELREDVDALWNYSRLVP